MSSMIKRSDSVKLASNENPLGPSPLAMRAVLTNITSSKTSTSFNRYPDGSGYFLKQALSERLSVSEDEIILGNGSNELIDIAVRTFIQQGDEAVSTGEMGDRIASAVREIEPSAALA